MFSFSEKMRTLVLHPMSPLGSPVPSKSSLTAGERLPKLIRTAAAEKYPITCIVGEAEAEGNSLAVRLYGGKDLGAIPTAGATIAMPP